MGSSNVLKSSVKPASSRASRILSGTFTSTSSPRLYFLQFRWQASNARNPALDIYSSSLISTAILNRPASLIFSSALVKSVAVALSTRPFTVTRLPCLNSWVVISLLILREQNKFFTVQLENYNTFLYAIFSAHGSSEWAAGGN